MFACQAAGVVPDVICLGKGLTGGILPLAATLASERVYEGFLSDEDGAALMHGPTFMGNALACAAANASLDLFEAEPRLRQVAAIEVQMLAELEACRGLSGVLDVRVRGAIGVVQMERGIDVAGLRGKFVERGVWVKPFGDVIYLTPPFVIGAEDLALLTGAVRDVVRELW
jgi:adenosylmethionine-8-amino-7-oxononanoate aminotransferase